MDTWRRADVSDQQDGKCKEAELVEVALSGDQTDAAVSVNGSGWGGETNKAPHIVSLENKALKESVGW
jgi:hypothetical protein